MVRRPACEGREPVRLWLFGLQYTYSGHQWNTHLVYQLEWAYCLLYGGWQRCVAQNLGSDDGAAFQQAV